MSHIVTVYGKNRDIPWVQDEQVTHIRLIAGNPHEIEDGDLIEHLRKFDRPQEGRGIQIVEKPAKSKNPSRMKLEELRELADSSDDDSRSDIMKKIRGEDNG